MIVWHVIDCPSLQSEAKVQVEVHKDGHSYISNTLGQAVLLRPKVAKDAQECGPGQRRFGYMEPWLDDRRISLAPQSSEEQPEAGVIRHHVYPC